MSLAQLDIRFNESEQYLQFSGASAILSMQLAIIVVCRGDDLRLIFEYL